MPKRDNSDGNQSFEYPILRPKCLDGKALRKVSRLRSWQAPEHSYAKPSDKS